MIEKDWEGSNYYQDLSISPDATLAEIKSAYRRSLRAYHPDLNSSADQSERFQAITNAYSVLKNNQSRNLYDEYLFGAGQLPRRQPEREERSKKRNLLFRAALFIIVLLLLRNFGLIGIQQQVEVSGSTNNNGGKTQNGNTNPGDRNQVLALMVGPAGPPGPAGVAGKDGFIGLNGYQGKDGIAGAPGAVGVQGPIGPAGTQGLQGLQGPAGAAGVAGAGVAIVPLERDVDPGCPEGGTKFISSTGTISYACNGAGGGSGSLGAGYVSVLACDTSVKISLETAFIDGQFKMSAIIIDQLSGACDNQTLSAVLKIKSSPLNYTTGNGNTSYNTSHSYLCSAELDLVPNSGVDANSIALTSADCTNTTTNANTFNDIWALDVSSASDALLLQVS